MKPASTNFLFNRFLQLTGLNKKHDVVIRIFELGECYGITRNQINRWSKINPETSNYQVFPDQDFAAFVQGVFGYMRIQQSKGVKVFNFDNDFIEQVVAMFFNYRDDKSRQGVSVFNFD